MRWIGLSLKDKYLMKVMFQSCTSPIDKLDDAISKLPFFDGELINLCIVRLDNGWDIGVLVRELRTSICRLDRMSNILCSEGVYFLLKL